MDLGPFSHGHIFPLFYITRKGLDLGFPDQNINTGSRTPELFAEAAHFFIPAPSQSKTSFMCIALVLVVCGSMHSNG